MSTQVTVTASRDYVAEMNAWIERLLSQDSPKGFVTGVAAASLYRHLKDEDPDLLEGWARAIVLPALSQAISRRISSQRATSRKRTLSRAFGEAANGEDKGTLRAFTQLHVADEHGTWKAASDMTGPEHEFVAVNTYERPANTALMLAAFHRAVAGKVGDRRTGDVMDADAYDRMYQSIVKTPKGLVA